MEEKINIRLEKPSDFLQVENITREAFWNVYRPGCVEHWILHNLRKEAYFVKELDYVLEVNKSMIAHIAYAKGYITTSNGIKREILLFGPVSVLPSYQKKGYGESLINFTIQKAKQLGYPAIVITGNPAYYKKFGFESASKYEIYYEGMNQQEEFPFFMIKVLDKSKIEDLKGVYTDPPCYQIVEEAVEAFDKQFPYKVKAIRTGQLN